jgi:hypothetical protein
MLVQEVYRLLAEGLEALGGMGFGTNRSRRRPCNKALLLHKLEAQIMQKHGSKGSILPMVWDMSRRWSAGRKEIWHKELFGILLS